MTQIEEEIRRINKFMEWEEKSCHFLYPVEENEKNSRELLRTAFYHVMKNNYNNVEFHSLDVLDNKFKELKYEKQYEHFNPGSIHIVDCTNLSKDNFYTFKSLYEIGKPKKLTFIYYVPREKFIDYVMASDLYHFKTATIDMPPDELIKTHYYLQLKDTIENENKDHSSKKKKI